MCFVFRFTFLFRPRFNLFIIFLALIIVMLFLDYFTDRHYNKDKTCLDVFFILPVLPPLLNLH